ncbi:DNA methyltransferase [Photobacterium halotolerans]|uniref:DNA methyltransferase n=1 Tax=Photobacterium halotolerans TaxID=265726 RepID=UPI0006983198|nr:DNA methyltransferase [Photobacterium halotolerans]
MTTQTHQTSTIIDNNSMGSSDLKSLIIDRELTKFFSAYEEAKKPIEVDFRELVDWVPYSDSYTHYIHSYPAKLIKHIPIFFLNSKILVPESKSLVLDPFCGSGTVLLESLLAGHSAIGCDANPLARLIAKVKTTKLEAEELHKTKASIILKAKRFRKIVPLNVVNVEHWFSESTIKQLSKLYRAINEICTGKELDFFLVTFSSIVKKVSYADPNLSVPVKIKPEKYVNDVIKDRLENKIKELNNVDVIGLFSSQSDKNINRVSLLDSVTSNDVTAEVVSGDARKITKNIDCNSELLDSNSVDFIVTSPPYAGAQKYIRSSSLSLGWLGLCEEKSLRDYEKLNIGREHYSKSEYVEPIRFNLSDIDVFFEEVEKENPLRAHINSNYLKEMESAVSEMYRVLKNDKYCVIVIGNNEVCGRKFETQKYIRLLAERVGFYTKLVLVDNIHSRGLMTKRNKTASVINSEWILVFKK